MKRQIYDILCKYTRSLADAVRASDEIREAVNKEYRPFVDQANAAETKLFERDEYIIKLMSMSVAEFEIWKNIPLKFD